MDMAVNKTGADRFSLQIYLSLPIVLTKPYNASFFYGNICRFQFTGKYIYIGSMLQHQMTFLSS